MTWAPAHWSDNFQVTFLLWKQKKNLTPYSVLRAFALNWNLCSRIFFSDLKCPICHSLGWQIGHFSSEKTLCYANTKLIVFLNIILWHVSVCFCRAFSRVRHCDHRAGVHASSSVDGGVLCLQVSHTFCHDYLTLFWSAHHQEFCTIACFF